MKRRGHPAFRELDGILLLDKPQGVSSNAALQRARLLFRADKGGHTGSLDPLATGLLPLCFGEATKIAGLLLSGHKAYETLARLGVQTDSCDSEGEVTSRQPVPALSRRLIEQAVRPLQGRISQVPPIFSALKREGEPLYLKARRGESVEIAARQVEVHGIELLAFGPDWIRLRIECGSGTYVRSLVRDLGLALGCGAHVEQLRRLWVDPFRTPQMHDFDTLEAAAARGAEHLDAMLLPIEAGLAGFAKVALGPQDAVSLAHGQSVPGPGDLPAGRLVAVDDTGKALGLVEAGTDGWLRPRRLFRRSRALIGRQ